MKTETILWIIALGLVLIGILYLIIQTFRKQQVTKKNETKEEENEEDEEELEGKEEYKRIRNRLSKRIKRIERHATEEVNIGKAIGRLVGLILSLYVFSQIIGTVLPVAKEGCGETTTINHNTQYMTYNATMTQESCPFLSATEFILALFPIIAIIGTFVVIYDEVIKKKIRR